MNYRCASVVLVVLAAAAVPSALQAKNPFKDLLKGIGQEFKNIGRDVTGTAQSTTQGVKTDVQQTTGIPLTELELKSRQRAVKDAIFRVRSMVKDRPEADRVIVYLWTSLGQVTPGDDATLQQVTQYVEQSLALVRNPIMEEARFTTAVQGLEAATVALHDHQAQLPAGFDFATTFNLQPAADPAAAPVDPAAAPVDPAAAPADPAAAPVDPAAAADPVIAEYLTLREQNKDRLSGSGFFRLNTKGAGAAGSFQVVSPEDGSVLAEGAEANKVHQIRAGIFHLVVSVADATLYRFNVVILPRKIGQLTFETFGRLKIAATVTGTCSILEQKTGRPASANVGPGAEVTLPTGLYDVAPDDGRPAKTGVTVKSAQTVTVGY